MPSANEPWKSSTASSAITRTAAIPRTARKSPLRGMKRLNNVSTTNTPAGIAGSSHTCSMPMRATSLARAAEPALGASAPLPDAARQRQSPDAARWLPLQAVRLVHVGRRPLTEDAKHDPERQADLGRGDGNDEEGEDQPSE